MLSLVTLIACGSAGGDDDDGGFAPDAALGAPDSGRHDPDGMIGSPDAAPLRLPDAAPIRPPDAAPPPDAPAPPDAAPPPDAPGPLAEVSGLSCTNLFDPRLNWTGGTEKYLWNKRLEGFDASSCYESDSIIIDGAVGANSRIVGGFADEVYIVWVCGYDPSHADVYTPGRRMRVVMPSIAGMKFLPGSCTPL